MKSAKYWADLSRTSKKIAAARRKEEFDIIWARIEVSIPGIFQVLDKALAQGEDKAVINCLSRELEDKDVRKALIKFLWKAGLAAQAYRTLFGHMKLILVVRPKNWFERNWVWLAGIAGIVIFCAVFV